MVKILGDGAEAIIYADDNGVVKDRVEKTYRLKEIDETLRKSRTRREAKILKKLETIGFSSPKLISTDDKSKITMDEIKGDKIRDILDKKNKDYKKLSREIGKKVRILHDNSIIHGDLTTSNMILSDGEVYLIDFGLSFFSDKVEDKAVDLHLLKQALESKHYKIWEECFSEATKAYGDEEVMKRLKKVEGRGRNKGKH